MQKNNRSKIVDNRFEQKQWKFYKSRMKSAESILKEIASVKSINKFQIEKIIAKAKNHLYPKIVKVDSYG